MNIQIKLATVNDAERIQKIQYASVRKNAEDFYNAEIIDAWAQPDTGKWINLIREAIQSDQEIVIVAQLEDRIVGFGAVVPSEEELKAVYVDPDFGRLGIGTKILQHLENIALDQHCDKLTLSGSLNAEAFYKKNGYTVLEYSLHTLSTGVKMKCVTMEKVLTI